MAKKKPRCKECGCILDAEKDEEKDLCNECKKWLEVIHDSRHGDCR